MEEFEVKFLNIDPAAIEKKILKAGGEKVFDRIFRRIVFDYSDLRLDKQNAWIRLRDEGDRVTLCFKQRILSEQSDDGNDAGMIEEEIEVSDFETTAAIFRRAGLTDKFYQENRRVQFRLKGVEVDIDYWPLVPPYLEIEGKNWQEVEETIQLLGLDPSEKKIFSAAQVFLFHGVNDKDYTHFTFAEQRKRL